MPDSPQRFPSSSPLADDLNLTKAGLSSRIGTATGGVYTYVVRSVAIDRGPGLFEQYGSAPNLQGGLLTLCTCKHQMRAGIGRTAWEQDKWVAGFTSRCIHDGRHWLFYLAKVRDAYESHADLWGGLASAVRKAKSAHTNFLGDVFAPRPTAVGTGRFRPRHYHAPARHSHRRNSCDTGWHHDIDAEYAGRRPSLLVFDPRQTFVWEEPTVFLGRAHCRNYQKWPTLGGLLRCLDDAGLR